MEKEVTVFTSHRQNFNLLQGHKDRMEKLCAGLTKSEKRKSALMCLERQFKAYRQFAENKHWDRREEYEEILNTCWNAVLDNRGPTEEIWKKHEEIKPENVNNTTKEYTETGFAFANIFAGNTESFLEMLLDDTGNEVSFCLFNIEFILNYLSENKIQDENVIKDYVKRETENQSNDLIQQKNIKNLADVRNWREGADNLIKGRIPDKLKFSEEI